jgi:hypothetical protein
MSQREGREPARCQCGGEYQFDRGCGCLVCVECEDHKGMCRCFCGWTPHGGDGYQELLDEGECIEPDDY